MLASAEALRHTSALPRGILTFCFFQIQASWNWSTSRENSTSIWSLPPQETSSHSLRDGNADLSLWVDTDQSKCIISTSYPLHWQKLRVGSNVILLMLKICLSIKR